LWISPYVPYDKVDHAGGKNHNYYVKYLAATGKYEITLLTLAHERQIPEIDLDRYGIKNKIGVIKDDVFHKLLRYCCNLESEYSPFNKFCGVFSNYQRFILEQLIYDFYKKNHSSPDIIFLQWTQTVLLTERIKKFFPDSKIVAIEEDVVYLAYERKRQYAHNFLAKILWEYKYRRVKKMEIEALRRANIISVNNLKDKKLLLSESLEKDNVLQGPIFYDNYEDVVRNVKNRNIIYFGAMGRKENYLSVVWLIEKILPLIDDLDINLLVIGGGSDKLKKQSNPKVKVLGFVEDLRPFFAESLCFVAPLVLGAGIKVKILEAFSAGIPVLTNHIGIEGIYATDGKEYFHCENPKEYAEKIRYLVHNPFILKEMSQNERIFVKRNFPLDSAMENLVKKIDTL